MVLDFSFGVIRSIDRSISTNPTPNPTFGFLIDHALNRSVKNERLKSFAHVEDPVLQTMKTNVLMKNAGGGEEFF